jgi:phage tail P2-like protein
MLQITASDFSALLPHSLRDDPIIRGLAAAFSTEYRRVVGDIPAVMPWERLDSLTEPVLSLLAYDVNPLLWDDAWTDAIKRDVLRNSLRWRMIHGTPVCVEEFLWTVMRIDARVLSWWEYDGPYDGHGEPGCFRLNFPLPPEGLSCPRRTQLLRIAYRAKNTRSHFDSMGAHVDARAPIRLGALSRVGLRVRLYPPFARRVRMQARVRAAMAPHVTIKARTLAKAT